MRTHTKSIVVAIVSFLLGSILIYLLTYQEDFSKRSQTELKTYSENYGYDEATEDIVEWYTSDNSWVQDLTRKGDLLTLQVITASDNGLYSSITALYVRNYNIWDFVYSGQEGPDCALLHESGVKPEEYAQLHASIFKDSQCFAPEITSSWEYISYNDFDMLVAKSIIKPSTEIVVSDPLHPLLETTLKSLSLESTNITELKSQEIRRFESLWRSETGYPIKLNSVGTARVLFKPNLCYIGSVGDISYPAVLKETMTQTINAFEAIGFEVSPINSFQFTFSEFTNSLVPVSDHMSPGAEFIAQGMIHKENDQAILISLATDCEEGNEFFEVSLYSDVTKSIDEQLPFVTDLGSNNILDENFNYYSPITIEDMYGEFEILSHSPQKIYATLTDGKWIKRASKGFDEVRCEEIEPYQFPTSMIKTCRIEGADGWLNKDRATGVTIED